MDWSILKKICLAGMLLFLAISLRPWSICVFSRMDSAQISSIAEGGTPGDSSVDSLGEAGAFTGGFFGAIPACYRAHSIGRASWQWPTILGFLGGFILFRQLQQHEYVSRVRKASGAHLDLSEMRREKQEKKTAAPNRGNRPAKPEKKKKSLDDERADW
jgi:hypothetical protein